MPKATRSSVSTAACPTPIRSAAANPNRAPRGASRCSIDRGEIFIANTPDEVERAFSDYQLIFSLGVGAIMNVPIRFRGHSLGTMNICSEAGWFTRADRDFTRADRDPGRLLAGLLVPPLFAST
jgi:hypothetical protein